MFCPWCWLRQLWHHASPDWQKPRSQNIPECSAAYPRHGHLGGSWQTWKYLESLGFFFGQENAGVIMTCTLYDHGAWFLMVIISSSCTLCCLSSVQKQKHDFFCSIYDKTIIRFLWYCYSDLQNNQGLHKGYLSASADNPYLDYCGYHKNLIQ